MRSVYAACFAVVGAETSVMLLHLGSAIVAVFRPDVTILQRLLQRLCTTVTYALGWPGCTRALHTARDSTYRI